MAITKQEQLQLDLLRSLITDISKAYGKISESKIRELTKALQGQKYGYREIVRYIDGILAPAFVGKSAVFLDNFTLSYTLQQTANFKAGIALNFGLKDERIINMIGSNSAYSWSKYYGVKNSPEVQKQLKAIWSEGISTDEAVKRIMTSVDSSKKRTVAYTKTVVETQSSHLRGMADLQQYDAAGIEGYQYVALIDNVTTETCRSLNGKVYEVQRELKKQKKVLSDTNEIINKAIDNDTPDYKAYNEVSSYLHKNRPLVTENEDGSFTSSYVKATADPEQQGKRISKTWAGLDKVPNAVIPPTHFNCRSFLKAVFK